MIPLKFRAWDLQEEKMYPVKTISYEYDDTVGNKDFEWCVQYGTDEDLLPDQLGRKMVWHIYREGFSKTCELMQFTGRFDKSGKEIYDGDILKHDLWGISEVYWDKEGACFRGKNDEHDITLADHQLKRSKVIGNIYENSNLLK